MAELKHQQQVRLKWWPTPQDYNESVQNLAVNALDAELQHGLVYQDSLGLPRPVTGSFASVYRVQCKTRDLAFRCFLRDVQDQSERYALISDFVQNDDLPYTVTFHFLKEGIRVAGQWVPSLKMDWVEGQSLDQYIVENLANPYKLLVLQEHFITMMNDLAKAGIAHGDLQHGNVIVCTEGLRLVDYDGMYVPAMQGYRSNELGHRNYQHPSRDGGHFGPYLDNFSAWIIYASIRALQLDPRLLHQLGGGDDCLLFRQSDFLAPTKSTAFAAFEKHSDIDIQMLGRYIRHLLKIAPPDIPALSLPVSEVTDLEPLDERVPQLRQGARLVRGNLPDWLDEQVSSEEEPPTPVSGDRGWMEAYLETNPETPEEAEQRKSAAKANRQLSERQWLNKSWAVVAKNTQQQWVSPSNNAQQGNPGASSLQNATAHWGQKTARNATNATPPKVQQAPLASVIGGQVQPAQGTLSTTGTLTIAAVEPDLLQPVPRNTEFSPKKTDLLRPEFMQACMIFNPLVWMLFLTTSQAFTVDSQLMTAGVNVMAKIDYVTQATGDSGPYAYVGYSWNVNGQQYTDERNISGQPELKRGDTAPLRILPTDPKVHERLFAKPGAKLLEDQGRMVLELLGILIFELAIWLPATADRWFVRFGTPAMARVISKFTRDEGEGTAYIIEFEYDAGQKIIKQLAVNADEYDQHYLNQEFLILYNPRVPSNHAIYSRLRYIAAPSAAPHP